MNSQVTTQEALDHNNDSAVHSKLPESSIPEVSQSNTAITGSSDQQSPNTTENAMEVNERILAPIAEVQADLDQYEAALIVGHIALHPSISEEEEYNEDIRDPATSITTSPIINPEETA